MESLFETLLVSCGDRPGEQAAGAVRITTDYEPAAGPGTPVAPPTLTDEGPLFRTGPDGTRSVVLDSHGSSANRVEQALLQGHIRAGVEPALPLMVLDYDAHGIAEQFTSFEWPHRTGDAYLWQAELDGEPVGKTPLGKALLGASPTQARPLFDHVPHVLAFGAWHSFSHPKVRKSRRALRLQRSFVAETIAYGAVPVGVSGGRMDPIFSESVPVEIGEDGLLDAVEESSAGEPSEVGLGMIPPQARPAGRVIAEKITRTAVISFAGLRKLRFAHPTDGQASGSDPDRDAAGRAVAAALALYGDRLAAQAPSISLRSGCDLVATGERIELVGGRTATVAIDLDEALAAFRQAVDHAGAHGLSWHTETVRLAPSGPLQQAIDVALPDLDGLYEAG